MNMLQCICGKCSNPISAAQHTTVINPDGIVEVTIICRCGRKFYGTLGIPENFEVLKNETETKKEKDIS